jgi:DNA-binding MarR family transcriptional regulator
VSWQSDEESLSEVFWDVARRLRRLSREAMAQWEISPSHARALGVLMHHGVIRLSELSEHLRIAPRSTTEVVDALEERDLVRRRPDPDDRRATLIEVTDRGRKVGASIAAARSSEAEEFFGALSASDRTALKRILRKLRD